ncbi:MAG: hypothetical protein IM638_03780 [Bacteroidetes bacterium]|nr:hypothetical protein [Bacteroidota bacterium]
MYGKKIIITAACILAAVMVWGHPGIRHPRDKTVRSIADYYGAGLGYRPLPLAGVNAFLAAQYGAAGFQSAMFSAGFETGAMGMFVVNQWPSTSGAFAFHYYPAQTVRTSSHEFRLSGYEFFLDGFSCDFLSSEKLVLTAGLGWALGRFRVVQSTQTEESRFVNPYFVPVLRTEFTILLGRYAVLGLRGLYRHDWSKTGWKQKRGNALPFPGTRLSGASATFFVAIPFLK